MRRNSDQVGCWMRPQNVNRLPIDAMQSSMLNLEHDGTEMEGREAEDKSAKPVEGETLD